MKRTGLLVLLSFLAVGCGNNAVPPVDANLDLNLKWQHGGQDRGELKHLQVTPGAASVPVGFQVTLKATAVYRNGRHEDVTAAATWTSSDPAVASVVAGVVQGEAIGHVKVQATLNGRHGSAKVRVTDAALVALQVTADASDVQVGSTVRARATGHFSSGRLEFVAPGLALALVPGPDRLVASLRGVSGGVEVNVTAGHLVGVRLRIMESSIPEGATTQVVMEATFTDGSVVDVSGDTEFGTEDEEIAMVIGPALVKGMDQGLTNVTGVYQGMSASAPLQVTEAEPAEMELLPLGLTLPLGDSAQLIAVGHYTDEGERDDSEDVTWISDDPAVASVSNVVGLHGIVWGVGQGQTTVTAVHVEQGVSAVAVVVVGPPALEGIVITPWVPVVATGATLQLAALGTYTDGSTGDVTAQMYWMSWSPALFSVDRGLVTGLAPGKGTVMAQDPTREVIVAYVVLTVN
jgi:hypothetical protein